MTTLIVHPSNWIINYDTSYYIISNLQNLSIHIDYRDNEDIIISDSNEISIIHTSLSILNSYTNIFTLDDILYALHIKKILILFF